MAEKDNPILFQIANDINLEVSEYKGNKRVDIRKWYEDGNGDLARTRKGVNMTFDEWDEFLEKIDQMKEFVNSQK
tara:strand:- start:413 stop:637 length:225 start_codon:yes stop_codon:yes gene_type:complete